MKNIFKYGAFALALFAMSCEEDIIIESNTTFVQLSNDRAVTVVENSGETITVSAILGAPQSTDTTVNFDVSGNADTSRYSLSATSVTIPAGDTSASISLSPIDNDSTDGDVDIILTLSSTSGLPLGIGGEGLNGVSKTITIVDDNAPCNDYTLIINTDFYANETHWYILDLTSGLRVQEDGNWVDGNGVNDGRVEKVYEFTLPDGCYSFRIWDEFADGQTDGGVVGNYNLSCGALLQAEGDGGFNSDGLSGATTSDLPTGWTFQAAPTTDYVGFVEVTDFCVNPT